MSLNPVVYFEIPVSDLERAIAFYQAVFMVEFERAVVDNNEMAFFPMDETSGGISGALVKGEVYIPTINGVIVYFRTDSIEETLERAIELGCEVLYPKTSVGKLGHVAEFKDSEGNRIALYSKAQVE